MYFLHLIYYEILRQMYYLILNLHDDIIGRLIGSRQQSLIKMDIFILQLTDMNNITSLAW